MAYVLEKLTREDREKIICDAAYDPVVQRSFISAAKTSSEFPENWAVDHERDSYFFYAVMENYYQSSRMPYYIFSRQRFYKVVCMGDNRFYFEGKSLPNGSEFSALKQDVCCALAVYGRYGWGAVNERGVPVWAVTPEFIEEVV